MKKYILFLSILILLLCSCSVVERRNASRFDIKPQKAQKKMITQEKTIGEASTEIIDKSKNRVDNISLACQSISGIKLNPGEEFSFNKITGEKSSERGYKKAPILVDGEKSLGMGGGVCQVSSTIYMAALSGGFKITEHYNHSESVAYAPNGTDAAVVYGVKDFRFTNNTDEAVYLYTWVEKDKVITKILKKQLTNH